MRRGRSLAVALRDRDHAFARSRFIDAPTAMRLAPEQDILPHAQSSDQFEMLVNQADRSACAHRAFVRLQLAERNCRERRFAGAVLADERVNLSGIQIEIHAVDRDDARKALRMPRNVRTGSAAMRLEAPPFEMKRAPRVNRAE